MKSANFPNMCMNQGGMEKMFEPLILKKPATAWVILNRHIERGLKFGAIKFVWSESGYKEVVSPNAEKYEWATEPAKDYLDGFT